MGGLYVRAVTACRVYSAPTWQLTGIKDSPDEPVGRKIAGWLSADLKIVLLIFSIEIVPIVQFYS